MLGIQNNSFEDNNFEDLEPVSSAIDIVDIEKDYAQVMKGKEKIDEIFFKLSQVESNSKNKNILKKIKLLKQKIKYVKNENAKITHVFKRIIKTKEYFNNLLNEEGNTISEVFQRIISFFSREKPTTTVDLLKEIENIHKIKKNIPTLSELISKIEKEAQEKIFENDLIDNNTNNDINNQISVLKNEIKKEVDYLKKEASKLRMLMKYRFNGRDKITFVINKLNYNIKLLNDIKNANGKIKHKYIKNLNDRIDIIKLKKEIALKRKRFELNSKIAREQIAQFKFISSLLRCKKNSNSENIKRLNKNIDKIVNKFPHLIPLFFQNKELRKYMIEVLPNLGRVSRSIPSYRLQNGEKRVKTEKEIIHDITKWNQWDKFNRIQMQQKLNWIVNFGIKLNKSGIPLHLEKQLLDIQTKFKNYNIDKELYNIPSQVRQDLLEETVKLRKEIEKAQIDLRTESVRPARELESSLFAFYENEKGFIESIKKGQKLLSDAFGYGLITNNEYQRLKISEENIKKLSIFEELFKKINNENRISLETLNQWIDILNNPKFMNGYFSAKKQESARYFANQRLLAQIELRLRKQKLMFNKDTTTNSEDTTKMSTARKHQSKIDNINNFSPYIHEHANISTDNATYEEVMKQLHRLAVTV